MGFIESIKGKYRTRPYLYWTLTVILLIVLLLTFAFIVVIAIVSIIGLIFYLKKDKKKSMIVKKEDVSYKNPLEISDDETGSEISDDETSSEISDDETDSEMSESELEYYQKESDDAMRKQDFEEFAKNVSVYDGYTFSNVNLEVFKKTTQYGQLIEILAETYDMSNVKPKDIKDSTFIIFDETYNVVGYIGFDIKDGITYLEILGLGDKYKGKGIAKNVIKRFLKDYLNSLNVEEFKINVLISNTIAIDTYKKYFGCGDDIKKTIGDIYQYTCKVNQI